jgi:hypothetical protein
MPYISTYRVNIAVQSSNNSIGMNPSKFCALRHSHAQPVQKSNEYPPNFSSSIADRAFPPFSGVAYLYFVHYLSVGYLFRPSATLLFTVFGLRTPIQSTWITMNRNQVSAKIDDQQCLILLQYVIHMDMCSNNFSITSNGSHTHNTCNILIDHRAVMVGFNTFFSQGLCLHVSYLWMNQIPDISNPKGREGTRSTACCWESKLLNHYQLIKFKKKSRTTHGLNDGRHLKKSTHMHAYSRAATLFTSSSLIFLI